MEDAEKVVRYPALPACSAKRGFENVSVGGVMKAAGLTQGGVLCLFRAAPCQAAESALIVT
jgi:hypothetical protein